MLRSIEDLSRIQYIIRIEYFFDPAHQVQLDLAEYDIHISFLDQPDAVLSTDGASQAMHQREQGPQAPDDLWIVLTVGNALLFYPDMQVAIPGMSVTYGLKTVLPAQFFHSPDKRRKRRTGHHGIFLDRIAGDLHGFRYPSPYFP